MIIKRFFFITGILLLCASYSVAQHTAIHNQPDSDYRLALELFNKEKFGAAQKLFESTIQNIKDINSEVRVNAIYYEAICAVELFQPDAESMLLSFIHNFPTHPKQGMASLQMGNLHYRKRSYQQAIEWYNKVDLFDLSQREKEEFLFKRGYSYFMRDEMNQAKQNFFEIKSPASLYYGPAQYYYAHISYTEKNYETALISFNRITADKNFGPIVPYYIAHIYFLQGKYDLVIEYAPPLLEDASTRRSAEISRLIGESYFYKGDYTEAIPFLERYQKESSTKPSREDHYQIGFAYYNAKDFENAISNLEKVTNQVDSMSQNAYYHLADAYLKTDQKRFARNAFVSAYQMDFYPEIKQEALFNYAKLSYDLSFNPYNEAILAFQKYIETYPQSPRKSLAQEYLIDLYMTTKNYKSALASIEEFGITTQKHKTAYQRISYFRGVELYNNGDFTGAIEHFEKSQKYPHKSDIVASCIFWTAEAYYRMEQYDKALQYHKEFLTTPGAFDLKIYHKAYYTTGYAWFQKKDYEKALIAFRQFIRGETENRRFINDAYLRIADSYFMSKDYNNAIDYYKRAITLGLIDTDYAMYQKALVEGVKGDFNAKAESLTALLERFPKTSYSDDAIFELASTYMLIDKSSQALNQYNRLINNFPNSRHIKDAKLKTGLIYYNNNQDQKALDICKNVVEQYPGTKEAREALTIMKNIYVAMDRVDDYFKYAGRFSFADVTKSQQDTLTYVAAEQRYMQGDCTNAVKSFANYIEQFPDGIFSVNARFYKAECDFRMNELMVALRGYEYVLTKPRTQFSENAAIRASAIQFRLNNYEAALNHYITLENVAEQRSNTLDAKIGQMRCYYQLSRFDYAIMAANAVIADERAPREILQEAHLLSGRAHMISNEPNKALQSFTKAANLGETEMAAESKYNLALLEFRKGDYKKSEQLIFKYINEIAAYDYWLAKIFLLLADNYLQTENIFQAKHTLQSIIENYSGEELNQLARQKLSDIEKKEEEERMKGKSDSLEVEF
ncbi:MAG: tetratricopeptide repeat protein [Bacteroidetes bacterium]|nr:tetratricopeptide repeat protein [Bacteroidota bacterium]